jgi:hypothetical protein
MISRMDYSPLDVYEWRPGMFGVVMLRPAGFHETFVFDCRDGRREIIHRDVYIPKEGKTGGIAPRERTCGRRCRAG